MSQGKKKILFHEDDWNSFRCRRAISHCYEKPADKREGKNADRQLSVSLKQRRKWLETSANHKGWEARVTAAAAASETKTFLKGRLSQTLSRLWRIWHCLSPNFLVPAATKHGHMQTLKYLGQGRMCASATHNESRWVISAATSTSFYCNNDESKCFLSAAAVLSWLALRFFCNNLFMPEVKYEHCSFKSPPLRPFFFFFAAF